MEETPGSYLNDLGNIPSGARYGKQAKIIFSGIRMRTKKPERAGTPRLIAVQTRLPPEINVELRRKSLTSNAETSEERDSMPAEHARFRHCRPDQNGRTP